MKRPSAPLDLQKALLPLHKNADSSELPKTASTGEKSIYTPQTRRPNGPPIKVEYSRGRTFADVGLDKATGRPKTSATAKTMMPPKSNHQLRFVERPKNAPIVNSFVAAQTPKSFTPRRDVDHARAKRKTLEFVEATHKQLTPKAAPKVTPTIRFATPSQAKPRAVKQVAETPRKETKQPAFGQFKFVPASSRRAVAPPREPSPSHWLPKLGFEVKKPSTKPVSLQSVTSDIKPVVPESSPLASTKTTSMMFR